LYHGEKIGPAAGPYRAFFLQIEDGMPSFARSLAGLLVVLPLALCALLAADPKKDVCRLKLLVPADDVEVLIQGAQTTSKGKERLYESPPLEYGKRYAYKIEMVWEPNNYTKITRTRTVTVMAGKTVELDLRQHDDQQPDKVLIRFVPTPEEVVDAMMKLGGVGPDDVVYDLGCGDGRFVIRAVEKFKAKRGVGIDIDPERVKESRENVKLHKLEDRVEIRQGDVLDIKDLSQATVVMLYMGEEMNLRLRPVLQKTLKPGSRIVSHAFTMGDWKPHDHQSILDEDGIPYEIYLWIVGKDEKKP